MATAAVKGYRIALIGPAAGEEALLTTEINLKAYNDLLLSCQDDITFGMIDEAVSQVFAEGDAQMAWKNLKNRFEPNTGAAKVQLKMEFQQTNLGEEEDPDEWITKLELIRRRLKTVGAAIQEEDLILHILNNLPKMYETTAEICEDELSKDTLTLASLKERLRTKYRRTKTTENVKMSSVALFAKQFKGMCNVCGKVGHKGVDCFTLEKNKEKKDAFIKKMNNNRKSGNYQKKNFAERKCYKCGKTGHIKANCPEFKPPMDSGMAAIETEVALMANTKDQDEAYGKDTWIGDTGASCHMTNDLKGLFEVRKVESNVQIGNGNGMKAVATGNYRGTIIQKNGKKVQVNLANVCYVPNLVCNLFSITSALSKEWKLGNEGKMLKISNGESVIKFDQIIGKKSGHLCGVHIKPRATDDVAMVGNKGIKYTLKKAHQILGHPSVQKTISTAKALGWRVEESNLTCIDCNIGKAKQKNIKKDSENKATEILERLSMDISSVQTQSKKGRKRFWLLVVDQFSNCLWSFFLFLKSDEAEVMSLFVDEIEAATGKKIKYIRCDNAGENIKTEERFVKDKRGITFEYTARNTPQQNGKVERAFATLFGRVRAMLNQAGMERSKRDLLWTEAAATATKLENILVNKQEDNSPFEQMYGKLPSYAMHLRTFGEIGIVALKTGNQIKAKLDDRGTVCMFVGYAKNHAGNVYRMLNTKTNAVIVTRDVTWTNKMFYQQEGNTTQQMIYIDTEKEMEKPTEQQDEFQVLSDETDTDKNIVSADLEGTNEEPDIPEDVFKETYWRRLGRPMPREIKGLRTHNNPGLLDRSEGTAHFCFIVNNLKKKYILEDTAPTTFREAWDHPRPHKREEWRNAIRLEFSQIIKNMVWKRTGVDVLPEGRIGIGTKWIFKEKKNGVFCARLVAKGYDQIAGVDFQENFAPVTSDVTLRMLLVLWISKAYYAETLDVKTAFLHGKLEEEIFLKWPEGYTEYLSESKNVEEKNYIQLNKSIYGLVQAARTWWKTFIEVLKVKLNFKQFANDNCLLTRTTHLGNVMMAIYVDDCLIVGDKNAVKCAIEEIKKNFDVTHSPDIEEFVGCTIERDGEKLLLSQPDLIRKLAKQFHDQVERLKVFDTPAAPGIHVIRPLSEEEKLGTEEQTEYRSGVGSLLYLLKHSRPDLSNSVRELSKVMDGANKNHLKMLRRVVKFVIDTQDRKLILQPKPNKVNWEMRGYSDSDFAGDVDGRKSISGYIIYVQGCPISWRSKGQKSVSLSSTEAEYMAVSEVATEILFMKSMMDFLGVPVSLPIEVYVDNVGAIYLSKSATTSNRTRHIDTRYHFVRDYIDDGVLKIVFVRSEFNHADIMTKNLSVKLYEQHSDAIMKGT